MDPTLTKLIRLAEEGDMYLQEQIDDTDKRVAALEKEEKQEVSIEVQAEKVAMKLATKLAVLEKGEPGEDGEQGESGLNGTNGKDGAPGKDGKEGKAGHDGLDGRDGRDGADGKDGQNGTDGSPDTPDQVIEKINTSSLLIKKERIEGLADAMRNMLANAVAGVAATTNFFNGLRAKNLTIAAGSNITVASKQTGDLVTLTITGQPGGGGGSFLTPTGTVNSNNTVFGVATQPTMVIADGMGRVEGFGYSYSAPNITMDIAPQDFIRYM